MKILRLFMILGVSFAICLIHPLAGLCQDDKPEQATSHLVVIGAFAIQSNAKRYTKYANQVNLRAQYLLNPKRNLYYVYVLKTPNQADAVNEALRLRNQDEFSNAWVYHLYEEKIKDISEATKPITGIDSDAASGQVIEDIKANDQPVLDSQPPVVPVENKIDSVSNAIPHVEGANFIFRIFRGSDAKELAGDVDVIDVDRTRKLGAYKGNAEVKVSDPASKSDNISLVCEVFGYRKLQRDVNFNLPEGEGIEKNERGLTVIPFEMARLRKGDIAVMYNVFFYKDAAIMRPESKYEVTGLLDMLKENPKCKIKIHGHANGGGHGKIISLEKGSTDFFTLPAGTDGFGSSTQLSEERAEIIRDYLISNGIEESRLQVKAWGGKRPIHDKNSARAQENVRVEIEILEN